MHNFTDICQSITILPSSSIFSPSGSVLSPSCLVFSLSNSIFFSLGSFFFPSGLVRMCSRLISFRSCSSEISLGFYEMKAELLENKSGYSGNSKSVSHSSPVTVFFNFTFMNASSPFLKNQRSIALLSAIFSSTPLTLIASPMRIKNG